MSYYVGTNPGGAMRAATRIISALAVLLLGCESESSTPVSRAVTPASRTRVVGGQYTLQAGRGAPVLDGILTGNEWSAAPGVSFPIEVPVAGGGGSTTATLFAMNDDHNLYLAFALTRSRGGPRVRRAVLVGASGDSPRIISMGILFAGLP